MKNYLKRTVCALLAVIMLVSVCGISAFADSAEDSDVMHYSYYTVLGDSIASAYGTDAYFANAGSTTTVKDGSLIPGSYAAIVADAIGAETVNMRSHSGWRTTEFLREINYPGFVYDNDAYSKYYHSNFFRRALNFVPESALNGEGARIIDAIKKADFITLNIGTNDIFSYALTVTADKFSYIFEHSGILDIKGYEDLEVAFNELLRLADENEMKGILTEFVIAIETGLAMYKENFPKVIDGIRSLNPDAQLMVIGISNPINIVIDLAEDTGIDLYTITDLLVDRANYFTATCSCADEFLFVDVAGTEPFGIGVLDTDLLFAFDENVKYSAVKMVHPNDKGHEFIAQQILSVLESETIQPVVSARYSSYIKRSTLNWQPVDGAVKYYVYRSTSADGYYRFMGASYSDVFYDNLTLPGVTYYYKVCAVMNTRGTICTPCSEPVALRAIF